MNKKQDYSTLAHNLRIFALVEFGFGILLILYGTQSLFLLFDPRNILVAGVMFLILLILFATAAIFSDKPMNKPDAKGFDSVICILMLVMLFLSDMLGAVGMTIVGVVTGVSTILLSVWHFKSSMREDDKSQKQFDNVLAENGAEGEI